MARLGAALAAVLGAAGAAACGAGRRLAAWAIPGLAAASVLSGLHFYAVAYQRYPLVSAGFWGWQSGPREMIAYFRAHHDEYDQFFMDGAFNGTAPVNRENGGESGTARVQGACFLA